MSLETAMSEIVGVRIGGVILRDVPTIITLLEQTSKDCELVSRARMAIMAASDLGPKWKEWAEAPTLFTVDANGCYRWPKAKGAK